MSDLPHLPDWDERLVELGKPALMDIPSLIEWLRRQLETPEETAARHEEMDRLHREWHATAIGIYGCCIQTGQPRP